jgi:hypothetical protein
MRALIAAACALGLSACAATQEIRAMHRELSVQVARVEEAVKSESEKIREEATKSTADARKVAEELRDAVAKTRAGLEQELGALRAKVTELTTLVGELKKGTRIASSPVLSDIEVRAVGENAYRVSRKQLGERSYELSRLLAQVPLAPFFEGDKRTGLRVVEVNGFLERFGILPGDVVQKINGLLLLSAEQTREVFQSVREAQQIVVDLLRGGQKLTLTIQVGE